jgi:hypothetical protein
VARCAGGCWQQYSLLPAAGWQAQQPTNRPPSPPPLAGVVDYALSALEALAGSEKGLAAVAADGGGAALESYLAGAERSPASEDAVARAQRLLAALAAVAIFD